MQKNDQLMGILYKIHLDIILMNLHFITRFIRDRSKYDLSGIKNSYIEKQIEHHCQKQGISDYHKFYDFLQEDPKALAQLVNACLNNATRYFRNPQLFEVMRHQIFPDLIANKSQNKAPLKIWVTACSTGDEAYSLAITLQEVLETSPIQVDILATDLSFEVIKTAQEGITIANNLLDVNDELRKKYFNYKEGRYYVKSVIKNYVKFEVHDFLNPEDYALNIPQDFDLIICRNALLYYETTLQVKAIEYLHKHLATNGLLVLSEFELMPSGCAQLFEKTDMVNYFFSKK